MSEPSSLHPARTSMTVRPNDLDSLRHVNHAVVLEYFEAGRWDWLARNELVATEEILPVVCRAEVDYQRQIDLPRVEVHTALVESIDPDELNYRVRFRQRLCAPDAAPDDPLVDATIHVAFVDRVSGALASAQDFLRASRPSPSSTT